MTKSEVLEILAAANKAPRKDNGKFVGAIYDTTSQAGDNPVALVVGINYGQCETSRSAIDKSEDVIGYAKHVAALDRHENGRDKPMHTVLWNFYPYLTEREWLDDVRNSADEAVRIFEKGYEDPFAVFCELATSLDPEIVVFHGVTSSVPILARVAIRRTGGSAFLVDNLARGLKTSNIRKIS